MGQMGLEAQFAQMYATHADSVFRFCMFKVSNRETALDLTQDTFMRLWDVLSKGNTVENDRAFLFTAARNLVIDHYRKRKTVSLDDLQESGFDVGDPSSAETESEFKEAVEAIKKLGDPCRDVLLLRYVEELPPRDIAEVLEESVNAISVRINRCTKKLKELMHAHE